MTLLPALDGVHGEPGAGTIVVYYLVYEHARFMTWDTGSWTTQVVALLGVDFAYYWWHRWTHEMNIGWVTHVVHHQSEDYNLGTALQACRIRSGCAQYG